MAMIGAMQLIAYCFITIVIHNRKMCCSIMMKLHEIRTCPVLFDFESSFVSVDSS